MVHGLWRTHPAQLASITQSVPRWAVSTVTLAPTHSASPPCRQASSGSGNGTNVICEHEPCVLEPGGRVAFRSHSNSNMRIHPGLKIGWLWMHSR